jgi:hypothetical protein
MPTTRETSSRERGNYGREMTGNFADKGDFHANEGSLTCHKSVTRDRRLYFPSEGRHAEDLFALKNLMASNPRTWVPEASMLTHRPPKLLSSLLHLTPSLCCLIIMGNVIQSFWQEK